jgi:glutathione synthase/RimK-type ligase-like ATP-grasp enzyme
MILFAGGPSLAPVAAHVQLAGEPTLPLIENSLRESKSSGAIATALSPTLTALNELGASLVAEKENGRAKEVFAEAVARYPNDAMTRVNLANLLIKNEEPALARQHLEYALKIDANFRPAHAGLAFVLPRVGETELARWHGSIAFQGSCLVAAKYRGDAAPIRVLELISTSGGNVRIRNFLSDRVFQRYLVTAEFYDASAPLPPHDLVVNAIGDADLAAAALAGAAELLSHTDAPVINAPAAVTRTGRAEIAGRLASIPGVVTARTAMLDRRLLEGANALAALTGAGFSFPLLLRSPGFHGGEHFVRIESADELPAALDALPGRELLAIEYLDARSADGKCRKYRVMMIDGRLYPLHCAVSRHWKIHFFSAEMADFPEHRAEDAMFLADMEAVLGPRAMAALEAIQATLGLDYGGIDFGLDQQGNVLLFEANATMVILPPGAEAKWDYRRSAVERVCRAVHAMLIARAKRDSPADSLTHSSNNLTAEDCHG